jgi:hypothetical protein
MIIRPIRYALAAFLVLLLEVAIALWVHDRLVRPYLGDSLAVVLIYCGLRAATPLGIHRAVAAALAIACIVEVGQWFGYVDLLGLSHCPMARVMLGTGFDPRDFLAYASGAVAIVLGETLNRRNR